MDYQSLTLELPDGGTVVITEFESNLPFVTAMAVDFEREENDDDNDLEDLQNLYNEVLELTDSLGDSSSARFSSSSDLAEQAIYDNLIPDTIRRMRRQNCRMPMAKTSSRQ